MICVVGYVYKYPAFMCNGGCIFQTGHAKKRNKNGLAEPLLLLLVVFLEGTRLVASISLAFNYVKELELLAINVVK